MPWSRATDFRLASPSEMRALDTFLARLREHQLAPLVALLVAALALLGFLKLGSEMAECETQAFDLALLYALRRPGDPHDPIGPRWLERATEDLTSLGSVAVLSLVIGAAVGYLAISRKRRDAVALIFATSGGLLLSNGLKRIYDRPRPDLIPDAVAHLNASFPSGHAMLSAVTYFTLATLLARAQKDPRVTAYLYTVAFATTLLIGTTRVYLGLHWPSDVAAGWCVGAAWAILCRLVVDQVMGRRS